MSEKSGRELDLAVAQAIGLKPPEDGNQIRLSAHTWLPAGYSVWPPRYSESTDLALEAWRQARGYSEAWLNIRIIGDHPVTARIGVDDYGYDGVGSSVAEAVCRALVAWKGKEI